MLDRRDFYDKRAPLRVNEIQRGYHQFLRHYYSLIIPPGMNVAECGCGLGDLLAALHPRRGLGIDFSPAMIDLARKRHPSLEFQVADILTVTAEEKFDYVVLSDLVNDLPDVQAALEQLHHLAHGRTRLVLNFFNFLWRPILASAERIGVKAPTLQQSWLSRQDMENLLYLAGWEVIRWEARLLWPCRTPLLAALLNRWIAPLFRHFCLSIFMIARPRPQPQVRHNHCTVVIPARNEAGNIESVVQRTPDLGLGTELIFIEGGSRDGTWDEIQRVKALYPQRNIKALKQQSQGKGGAVREAFAQAAGDMLFILDADLTVPPENLPKFYEALRSGRADFANGVRLVYPLEQQSMQFLNLVANKCFGLAFSWLLGTPIKDTLCGTKVLWRSDYELIAQNRNYFGDFDPFGDFDLLFGAAKLNLRMVDLPIRYQMRTYGQTNIQRWRHGWLLLRMAGLAARRLKFI